MKEIDAAIEALEAATRWESEADPEQPFTAALAGLRSLKEQQIKWTMEYTVNGKPVSVTSNPAPEAKQEADTRCKVKLGAQYGSDLEGHWFYLRPADEHAEAAMAKHSGIKHPAPQAKQKPCGYDESTGNCTSNPCCHPAPEAKRQ